MKIAIWHNLPSGGGKRALYYHVRGLVERGHFVEAWCPPSADQTYLPLGVLIREHVTPMDWRPSSRRTLWSRLLDPRHDIARGMAAMHRHSRRCAEEIRAGGFDVLLANTCQYFYAPPIGRYAEPPTVLYLQEPNRVLYEAQPELRWLAPRGGRRRFGPGALKRALADARNLGRLRIQGREEVENARAFDAILVNSQFSRESLLRAYGLDARVCYLGVDTDLFAPRGKPREDFVVGLGSLTPAKNVAFVVEALTRVAPPRPPLVWIGNAANQAYAEEVERLAASLGVAFEARVRVEDDELVDLLGRARLMLYAPRLEPFGYAPLEANACGLPVIAVAEGGIRETVLDGVNGRLVESDPAAMAAAMTALLADPAGAARLGAEGRRLAAERWSLPASIDRLEERLLERVRGRGPAAAPHARLALD